MEPPTRPARPSARARSTCVFSTACLHSLTWLSQSSTDRLAAANEVSAAIKEFWQKLIDDGFSDVEYLDPRIKVVDASTAELVSGWKMNKASGVIHKELWVLQKDGTAKLREDEFEAKE